MQQPITIPTTKPPPPFMAEKPNKDHNGSTSEAAVMTSDNYHVETGKSDRKVWLMKCPPVVTQALQNANRQNPLLLPSDASAGPIVAKVTRIFDPLRPNDDDSASQYVMELADTGDRNLPKRFSMDKSTNAIPMAVLSETSQGNNQVVRQNGFPKSKQSDGYDVESVFSVNPLNKLAYPNKEEVVVCPHLDSPGRPSVEGKIVGKFEMKPHKEYIEDYSKLCRERTNKYMTRTRQIQVIDNDNGLCMRPMPGTFDVKSSGSTEKKVQAKGVESKRTRRAPEEMEKIMFKLFERQPNWTLKQLIQTTDQPEQFLKDMLKSLCVYNNKGANQGSYELKPEYRRSEDTSDTS